MAPRDSLYMGANASLGLLGAAWQTRLAVFLSQTFPVTTPGHAAPMVRPVNPLSAFRRRAWLDNLLAAAVMDWRVDPSDPRKLWRDAHGEPVRIEHQGRERLLCAHPFQFGVNTAEDRVFNPAAEPLLDGDWDAFAVLLGQCERLAIALERSAQGYTASREGLSATATFSEAPGRHCACLAVTRLVALGALDPHRNEAPDSPKPRRRH